VANGVGIMVVFAVFFAFVAIFEHPKALAQAALKEAEPKLTAVVMEE